MSFGPTTPPAASRRGRRPWRRFRPARSAAAVLISAVGVLIQTVGVPVQPAQAASPAVSYTYDAAGRLASITTAAGTATYHYDAAGNVTSITHSAAAPDGGAATPPRASRVAPRVSAVSPLSVTAGQQVTITGSGFSPRAADDVVRVGSLMATVAAASRSRLRVTAPPGTGGKVTVLTPSGASTGARVVIRGAPQQASAVTRSAADRHPLRAAAGVTALAGQIDTARGAPLAGVRVSVSGAWGQYGASAVSNAAGQFLLRNLSAGRRTLTIDGSTLSGGRNYGLYSEPVELPKGRTSVLPWITYLTPIAPAVPVASPTRHQVTLTTPRIPGLKVVIPAGTVIRDRRGKVVRSLSITPLPTARTPMPWGPGMVPAYFTIQPGDASISGPGLRVIYPNSTHLPPGESVPYLAENPSWAGSGWYRYGTGHVSASGHQIVPDAGVRYKSTDPGGFSNDGAPGEGPPPGGDCQCGDPVDLATGLFASQSTDISLPDIEGVTLTRDFRQLDDTVRDFGIGGSDSLDLYIVVNSSGDFELILPNGGGVDYTPTSTTGVYQAVNTPTDYAGSTLFQGDGDPDGPFTLTLRNGTQMAFGNPSFLTAITDRYGNTLAINRIEFENSSQGGGQIQTVTTPNGRWLQFTYGVCFAATSTKCVTQVTDDGGRTVSYGYDASGRLTKVTNVSGGVTKYAWATCTSTITCTELTSVTDPLGRVTKIAYNATGLVTGQTQPNGGKWKYAYTVNSSGAVTKTVVTDPNGNKSSTSLAATGYSTNNTVASGTSLAATSTATYEPGTGLVKSTTDALGRTTTYTYDTLGNPLTVTTNSGTPQAATTTYTYEPTFNRLASVTDALGRKTTITYNDKARTETVTDSLGHKTVTTDDDHGETVSTTTPDGNTTNYSYLYGLLVATANPLGNVASTYYNSIGQPVLVGYPDGSTTSYTYDAAGDQLTATDPLGNTTSFTYDADGELTSYTDANGHKTSYTYDGIGDVLAQTDPLGKTATWTYDADGNALTSTDRDGNVTHYAYDGLGLLTTTKYGVTGSASYDTVTTAYDQASRPTKITDSLNGAYTYAYDNRNNLTSYTSPQGSISYTYDADSERTGMTVAGQPAVSYTYNAGGEITKLAQGPTSASFSYDASGNLTGATLPNGITQASTYNAASELTGTTDTKSSSTIGSVQYTYNPDGLIASANGSLASASLPAAVTSETYNAGNELTKINGGTSLAYDSNGSLTSDGANTYAWNPLGQLSSVTTPTAAYAYTYNPAGRRITTTSGGVTTSSLYDGGTLAQQSSGGSPIANYLSAGAGGTVQVQNSAGTSVPLTNQVGSTTSLTGTNGQIATSYTYDPAGNTTVSGAANPDPERYAASQADPTGLDQMGARYYDPALGRFISQDPLGLAGGSPNLYEYAQDNPVNSNDPSGMCGSWCQGFANFGAGVLNGLSFGLIHVPPPFCGPGADLAYGFGNILGQIGTSIALAEVGGPLLGALGESLEFGGAAEEAGTASEVFYRTMSQADFETLQATGSLPATSETFISPSLEYASGYDGVTVQFSVEGGTTDSLAEVGVRDSSNVVSTAYPDMPTVSSGWTDTSAFFKGEGGIINIGLGQGTALDIFNAAVQSFEVVP